MMRKLLMIANDFPPIGGAGVQRTVYFAKYLPEFEWQPIILTVKDVAFPAKDASLIDELPRSVNVIRTESFELRRLMWLVQSFRSLMAFHRRGRTSTSAGSTLKPGTREFGRLLKRWLFVPDDRIMWTPFAVVRALRLIKKMDIRAIYATVPCYSSGVIGYLVSLMSGRPLFLDLRDPWTQDPYLTSPTRIHAWLNARMEATAVNRASRVIVISEAMAKRFRSSYPQLAEEKLVVITNGSDTDAFAAVKPETIAGKFVVAYVGSLYAHHRDALRAFLQAWGEVAERNKAFDAASVFWVVGRCDPEVECELREWKNVPAEILGYRAHAEGLSRLKGAATLLLLIKDLDPDVDLVTIPGKLFEYVAAGPPIIMIGPEGDAAEIVRGAEGAVLPQNNVAGIASSLEGLFQDWSLHPNRPAKQRSSQYDRKSLTGRLAAELDAGVFRGSVGRLQQTRS